MIEERDVVVSFRVNTGYATIELLRAVGAGLTVFIRQLNEMEKIFTEMSTLIEQHRKRLEQANDLGPST
jgi:hypothetical protein